MHHSLRNLLHYDVVAEETTGRIEDFLFDESRLHVAAVAVDLGNWLVRRSAILSTDRLGRPEPEHERIPLNVTREEAEDAPAIENWDAGWFDAPAYTSWPPIIIGPAGGTISPLLLQAQAQYLTGNTGARISDDSPGELTDDPRRLRSLTTTLSGGVFCADGEFGRITDMLLRPDSYDIGFLVIDTGGLFSHHYHAVPAAALSHFAAGDNYAVLHVTQETVKHAPVHEDPAEAGDAWLGEVEEYYRDHLPGST